MNKLGICFSGQGSQYVGMALDFIDFSNVYKDMAKKASEILNFDVIETLSDQEKISNTRYTQPLMVLKSIFGFEEIKKLNPIINAVSGFSLGEFSAYYAAAVFDFYAILKIVSKRAIYMDDDTKQTNGKMAAIIGLSKSEINDVCQSLSTLGVIQIANENEPNQFVISGEENLVEQAIDLLKAKGARRAILLQTSGAFHTPLMENASKKLLEEVKKNVILKPKPSQLKMYMNKNASVLNDNDILDHIKNQMTHKVQFIDMVLNMKKDGITHILEIGPGKVLTNLIKKIDSDIETCSFDKLESLDIGCFWYWKNNIINTCKTQRNSCR